MRKNKLAYGIIAAFFVSSTAIGQIPPAPGAGPAVKPAPVAVGPAAGGVALASSCNIPTGTATQTIRDPVQLSATEISFFDVGTGAAARSLWVNPTPRFVASVACVSGKPVAGVAAVPRSLSCKMSTMNPVPTGGTGVKVIAC